MQGIERKGSSTPSLHDTRAQHSQGYVPLYKQHGGTAASAIGIWEMEKNAVAPCSTCAEIHCRWGLPSLVRGQTTPFLHKISIDTSSRIDVRVNDLQTWHFNNFRFRPVLVNRAPRALPGLFYSCLSPFFSLWRTAIWLDSINLPWIDRSMAS